MGDGEMGRWGDGEMGRWGKNLYLLITIEKQGSRKQGVGKRVVSSINFECKNFELAVRRSLLICVTPVVLS
ncbi:MAG: hypothetical protein F6K47_26720 [Symploca sp. SIO2E6]|nr:hypothetical protein [Symploca sp. SIO2E6]